MKILLAVDGSDCSHTAVEEVAHRPWPAGSAIKVISAVELPYPQTPETWALPDNYYAQLEQINREQARLAVSHAVTRLQSAHGTSIEIQTALVNGRAKDVILDEAVAWGADLIVLGSHGYSGLKRFLLGSVSHAVVAHAPCSVEIVRGRVATK